MAISLVKRLEPWWFTPESQKEEAAPARFLLAPLPRQVMFEINALVHSNATRQEVAAGLRMGALAALTGWENVTDADGKPAPFSREQISDLPVGLLAEIGSEVIVQNRLSEGQVKNSSSPSTSANGQSSSSAEDATAGETRTASGETRSRESGSSKASA